MQATITYLLTEQAQRAQIAATGQPVARKQTTTMDVTPEDLLLLDVGPAGEIYLDMATPPTNISAINLPPMARKWRAQILGGDYCSNNMPEFAQAPTPEYLRHEEETYDAQHAAAVLAHDAEIAARPLIDEAEIRNAIEYHAGKRRSSKLYKTGYALGLLGPLARASRELQLAKVRAEEEVKEAARLAKQAEGQAIIDAFLADPAARALRIDSGTPYWIELPNAEGNAVQIHRDEMGQEAISAVAKEARRRDEADKAAKESAKAAKEAAKLEYLKSWIAEHGNESQKARSAEGLLCREEAISALADATFAPLEVEQYGPRPGEIARLAISRYTNASRPEPKCTNEACLDQYREGCKVEYDADDSADCLDDTEYRTLASIRAALPGAAYVLRTHTAVHDCDHQDDCKMGENHGCMVKATVGPFTLQREYEL